MSINKNNLSVRMKRIRPHLWTIYGFRLISIKHSGRKFTLLIILLPRSSRVLGLLESTRKEVLLVVWTICCCLPRNTCEEWKKIVLLVFFTWVPSFKLFWLWNFDEVVPERIQFAKKKNDTHTWPLHVTVGLTVTKQNGSYRKHGGHVYSHITFSVLGRILMIILSNPKHLERTFPESLGVHKCLVWLLMTRSVILVSSHCCLLFF